MTLVELKKLLDQTGYPVAYNHFTATTNNPVPSPPFIVYMTPSQSNFLADNKAYTKINNVTVELYTNYKDLAAEQTLESLFDENEISWDADEVYIETEKLYQRIYEIGVI